MQTSSAKRRVLGKWFISNVLTLALMLGLIALPAQAVARGAQDDKVPASAPDTFSPGKINRTPVGGPIPDSAGKAPKTVDASSSKKVAEIVERRTVNSKTSTSEDGHMVTEFFTNPVHFKDKDGKSRVIDNKLVPAKDQNGTIRNAANKVNISLPGNLATGPARVERTASSWSSCLREPMPVLVTPRRQT